jgi:hypothetical protein
MRSDTEIRHDVQEELDWDPRIGARDIAVSVRDGVVTLAGFVRSLGEKAQAEADAKRVAGVLGIANDIEVHLPLLSRKPDTVFGGARGGGADRLVGGWCDESRKPHSRGEITSARDCGLNASDALRDRHTD